MELLLGTWGSEEIGDKRVSVGEMGAMGTQTPDRILYKIAGHTSTSLLSFL